MKDKCCWAVVLGVGIALFGFAVAVHGWPWATGEHPAAARITDWLTAIGTVCAALGAVGVAIHAHLKNQSESLHRATSMKWFLGRWAGGVKTGSELLSKHLSCLAETQAGSPYPANSVDLIKHALTMINPGHVLIYFESLHVLGKDSSRWANVISLAMSLKDNVDMLFPMLPTASPNPDLLQSFAELARELKQLTMEAIDSLGEVPS